MKIQLLDIKLPEHKIPNIVAILESNKMPARVPQGEQGWRFNCWGFVAYYVQWEEKAIWLDGYKMEDHLTNYTQPISKEEVRAGDIAVFRRGEHLSHTALVLPDTNVICHKPGSNPLCIDTLEAASKSYGSVSYVRVQEKDDGVLTSDS